MTSSRNVGLLVCLVSFFVLIRSLRADIGDFDETWQKRAEEAQKAALDAYDPDPEDSTDVFNQEVGK